MHTFKVLEKHHCDFHADPVRYDWVPTPKSLSSQCVIHLANMLTRIIQRRMTGMLYKFTEFLITCISTWSVSWKSISVAFSSWWSGCTSCRQCSWPHRCDKLLIDIAKLLNATSFYVQLLQYIWAVNMRSLDRIAMVYRKLLNMNVWRTPAEASEWNASVFDLPNHNQEKRIHKYVLNGNHISFLSLNLLLGMRHALKSRIRDGGRARKMGA